MPQITTCPECSKQLRVPDDLIGRKVRCPGCSAMFTAEAERDPAPPPRRASQPAADPRNAFKGIDKEPSRSRRRDDDDDYDDRRRDDDDDRRVRRDRDDDYDDRRRRDRDDDYDDRRRRDDDYDDDYDRRPRGEAKALRGVRSGINLVVIAGWIQLATYGLLVLGGGIMVLAIVGVASRASSAPPGQGGGAAAGGAVGILGGLCLFVALFAMLGLAELVIRLIGMGMCMQAPSYRGSSIRGLAIAAFSCACAAVVINFGGGLFSGLGGGLGGPGGMRGGGAQTALMMSGMGNVFGWISTLAALAGFILWLFFLRGLAIQLRNTEVAGKVMAVFIAWVVFGVVAFLIGILVVIAGIGTVFSATGANSAQGAFQRVGAFLIFSLVMAAVLALAGLGLFVWYVLVMQRVRDVVDRYLKKL